MQVYTQEDELIERWQWNDPALRNLSNVVISLLEGQSGRVLDLGCGSGRMVAELARRSFNVDGIDVEERVIALGRHLLASRGLTARLYVSDVRDPTQPIAVGGYDVVVCTEVLEHVGPWRELLTRAGELLRPGGVLIVSVPRDPRQFSVLDSYASHLRRFRYIEILEALGAGYEQMTVRWLGFPSMRLIVWAYTTILKLSGRAHARASQALWRKPGPLRQLATTIFYCLLRFDNLFAGLPLGTTLVVRAVKRLPPA